MLLALEYAAFGGSLFSVWLYGRRGIYGPVAGAVTSAIFISFGIFAEIYAAVFSNIIFAAIHVKNFKCEMENDMERTKTKIASSVNYLVGKAHGASTASGWWENTDMTDRHVVPAKLCLIHSEISEAMEGHRKNLMDDKLPHRPMIEVELADAMIRIADLAGALELDLGGAVAEKMEFNAVRPDHKPENRAKEGGKTY